MIGRLRVFYSKKEGVIHAVDGQFSLQLLKSTVEAELWALHLLSGAVSKRLAAGLNSKHADALLEALWMRVTERNDIDVDMLLKRVRREAGGGDVE